MDYKNGKIYCIRSHQTDDIYIGSTTSPLYKRFYNHKSGYNSWKKGERNYTSSYSIMGYNDAYIELIEEYPCENRNQLNMKEGEYIRKMKCVNVSQAGRTEEEIRQQGNERGKRYRENNIEKVKERRKDYYDKNKDKEKERYRLYYEKNKEKERERAKQYRLKKKNNIL